MIRAPPTSTLFPYTTLSRPPATVLLDGDGRIVSVNRRWTRQGEVVSGAGLRPGLVGDHYLTVLSQHLSAPRRRTPIDRKSTRLNSSHANISYAVFCLKKKKT